MSFRFILWGDSSQHDSIADRFTQQAEAEFRNTYKAEFDYFAPAPTQTNLQPSGTSTDNSKQTALSGTVDAVSELVQTVADNLNADTTPKEVSEIVKNTEEVLADIKTGSNEILSDTVQKADGNDLTQQGQIKETNELVDSINAVNESIQAISQSVNEKPIVNSASNNSVENSANEAIKDLLGKMKDFLAEIKEIALSLLKVLRQPQLQHYYGVEDAIHDACKNEARIEELTKKKLKFEEDIIQKMLEVENDIQTKKKQMRLKDESIEETAIKRKQNELEKVLAMKIEETRNKNLFGR